jgi:hypothetical protein
MRAVFFILRRVWLHACGREGNEWGLMPPMRAVFLISMGFSISAANGVKEALTTRRVVFLRRALVACSQRMQTVQDEKS